MTAILKQEDAIVLTALFIMGINWMDYSTAIKRKELEQVTS